MVATCRVYVASKEMLFRAELIALAGRGVRVFRDSSRGHVGDRMSADGLDSRFAFGALRQDSDNGRGVKRLD